MRYTPTQKEISEACEKIRLGWVEQGRARNYKPALRYGRILEEPVNLRGLGLSDLTLEVLEDTPEYFDEENVPVDLLVCPLIW